MSHVHQQFNTTLRLAIGLRPPNPSELLVHAVATTAGHKGMIWRAFIFRAIIGIGAFDGLWTFLHDLLQIRGGRLLSFVGLDGRIEFSREIIKSQEQILPWAEPLLAGKQG